MVLAVILHWVGDIEFNWNFFSTVEDEIIVDPVDSPEIIDDFELGQEEAVDIKDKEVNKQKLRRRVSQYKVCCIVVYFKMWWKCWLVRMNLVYLEKGCNDCGF